MILLEVRVFNLFKHPEPQGIAPMNSRLRGFYTGMLVWVKSLSNEYQKTQRYLFSTVR